MTLDEAKRSLGQIQRLARRVKDLRQHAERLRECAGIPRNSTRHGGVAFGVDDVAVSIVRDEESIREIIDAMNEKRLKLIALIERIESISPIASDVLYARYVAGSSWPEIQRKLNCSERTVYRAHRMGLQIVSEMM